MCENVLIFCFFLRRAGKHPTVNKTKQNKTKQNKTLPHWKEGSWRFYGRRGFSICSIDDILNRLMAYFILSLLFC